MKDNDKQEHLETDSSGGSESSKPKSGELRESELRYRRLFEAAQDGILILDAGTGTISDANPFIIDLLGFSHEQLAGKRLWEIGAFKDIFASQEKFKELQSLGYVRYEGLPLIAADGRKLFVEFVSNVYKVEGANVIQCNIRDNTARREAELEKDRLNEKVIEKSKEIESFLYVTTHDLRTPLVNIQGFSKNLVKDLKELYTLLSKADLPEGINERVRTLLTEDLPESMGFITGGVLKMNMMIGALLKIARLGRITPTSASVDMDAVLKDVLGTFAYQLEKIGAVVNIMDLPRCSSDTEVVSQVFALLIDNAIKYRKKGRRLEIEIEGKATEDGLVRYTVSDNGLGIEVAELEKIWQVFYSGHTADPGVEHGEGIGLTIAKRMVERNGGKIRVESKEGVGTKFVIDLPGRK